MDDLDEIAEQIGGTREDAAVFVAFHESEEDKDQELNDFLDEEGLEGIDLDSGEFY